MKIKDGLPLIQISCSSDLEADDWSDKAALTEGDCFSHCRIAKSGTFRQFPRSPAQVHRTRGLMAKDKHIQYIEGGYPISIRTVFVDLSWLYIST